MYCFGLCGVSYEATSNDEYYSVPTLIFYCRKKYKMRARSSTYQPFGPESSIDTGLSMICTSARPTSGHLFLQCGGRQLSVDLEVTMQRPIEVVESDNLPNNNNSALAQRQ